MSAKVRPAAARRQIVGEGTTSVDACARKLRDAIMAGEYSAGMRLPSERDLAVFFKVNRVTVRSALAQLATLGLVAARHGSGTVVLDFHREGGTELLGDLLRIAREAGDVRRVARDLLVARRHLARGVLQAVLVEAKDADLDRIEAAIDAFAQAVAASAPVERLCETDVAVMRAVLESAHSPVLALFLNPVAAVLGLFPELRDEVYREPALNVAGLRELLAMLRARDPAAPLLGEQLLAAIDEASCERLAAARGQA